MTGFTFDNSRALGWKKLLAPFLTTCMCIGAGSGCAGRKPVAAAQPPAPDPARGQSSFEFLVDPPARDAEHSRYEQFMPPRPIGELASPEYPERALAAGYGPVSLAVRVNIGTEGQVTGISDIPGKPEENGPYASDFRQAVESAVHTWKFNPAELNRFEDGNDIDGDGKPDYQRLVSTEKVPVYFDVRFDFEILQGKGQVKTGGSP
jgi:hypothetical protein